MKEKLEWLTLLVPGGILAVLIVVSMFGNGPVLEDVPERWKAKELAQMESPVPIVTAKPDVSSKPSKKNVIPDNAVYGDGTFYGTGDGYGGPIKMKVVIAKGKMKNISVVSAEEETPEYFAKAKTLIPIMLKKQTSKVDVISGATYSSMELWTE